MKSGNFDLRGFEAYCYLKRIVENREVVPENCPEAYHVYARDQLLSTRYAATGLRILSLTERVGVAESFVEHGKYLVHSDRRPRRDADRLHDAQRRAIRLYDKAAALGCAEAKYLIGLAYASGEGVRRNLGKAQTFIMSAAEGGYKDAVRELLVPTFTKAS